MDFGESFLFFWNHVIFMTRHISTLPFSHRDVQIVAASSAAQSARAAASIAGAGLDQLGLDAVLIECGYESIQAKSRDTILGKKFIGYIATSVCLNIEGDIDPDKKTRHFKAPLSGCAASDQLLSSIFNVLILLVESWFAVTANCKPKLLLLSCFTQTNLGFRTTFLRFREDVSMLFFQVCTSPQGEAIFALVQLWIREWVCFFDISHFIFLKNQPNEAAGNISHSAPQTRVSDCFGHSHVSSYRIRSLFSYDFPMTLCHPNCNQRFMLRLQRGPSSGHVPLHRVAPFIRRSVGWYITSIPLCWIKAR